MLGYDYDYSGYGGYEGYGGYGEGYGWNCYGVHYQVSFACLHLFFSEC